MYLSKNLKTVNIGYTNKHFVKHRVNTLNFSKYSSDEKLEKFNGIDFKIWQTEYVLSNNYESGKHSQRRISKENGNPPMKEFLMTIEAWKQSNVLCKNYIFNRLENNLHDIHSTYKITKEV